MTACTCSQRTDESPCDPGCPSIAVRLAAMLDERDALAEGDSNDNEIEGLNHLIDQLVDLLGGDPR